MAGSDCEGREKLAQMLERKIADAELAYSELYNAQQAITMIACYSGAKENFVAAIALARCLGLRDRQEQLEARLAHVRAVFRSQFADFT